jgi:hypothetical protein
LAFILKTMLLGCPIGAAIGAAFCFLLSGGNASGHFYVTYGIFGGTVGLAGGFLAGVILGFARLTSPRYDA